LIDMIRVRVGQFHEEGLGEIPDALRVQECEAELQHLRAQREAPAVGFRVAELAQREQQAPGRRACEAGVARDFAQRHGRMIAIEGLDDREAASKRLDEVAVFARGRTCFGAARG
jgi:hypothetical protein